MSKIEELKIRMASLQKAPVFAKLEAGAELMQCAVELLEQQESRVDAMESRLSEHLGEDPANWVTEQ